MLLDLCRRIDPSIPAVFCDTGLEFPEIKEFVKTFDNVTILHPMEFNKQNRKWERSNFRKVVLNYGYPVISKEVSSAIYDYKRHKDDGKYTTRMKKLDGVFTNASGGKSIFDYKKYKYIVDSPFPVSDKCCNIMKKNPAKLYERDTGRKPITATMASESLTRKLVWMRKGCNAFDSERPISNPMSFWTEQDVLEYITRFKIPYCKIYGEILHDDESGRYYTTGYHRTGCIFCAYGAHLEKCPNRFHKLKNTHRGLYDYCMKPVDDGGLGLDEVLDFINVEH